MKRRAALIIGTRPEAIKMAPVLRELSRSPKLVPILISTGQHRELLDTTLSSLGLRPDHHLNAMLPQQSLNDLSSRVIERTAALLVDLAPALVVVQGDTTTVLAAALASYHLRIPIAHVEAGLRTYDLANPFPEEANRQLVDRLSTFCFAPTPGARDNLLAERIVPDRIHVTGNTAVDSVLWTAHRSAFRCPENTLLVTLHRRESFGAPLREIVLGILDFLRGSEAHVLWPVHPNPNIGPVVEELVGTNSRARLVAPLEYAEFAGALRSCRLVLTDSGGVQEEAPSLGKTVLVAREVSERMEGVSDGRNRIVGRTRVGICEALRSAWAEPPYQGPLPAPNPFGDGRAAERIAAILNQAVPACASPD